MVALACIGGFSCSQSVRHLQQVNYLSQYSANLQEFKLTRAWTATISKRRCAIVSGHGSRRPLYLKYFSVTAVSRESGPSDGSPSEQGNEGFSRDTSDDGKSAAAATDADKQGDGADKVDVQISPSVMKALAGAESGGSDKDKPLSLIEKNRLKRQARLAASRKANNVETESADGLDFGDMSCEFDDLVRQHEKLEQQVGGKFPLDRAANESQLLGSQNDEASAKIMLQAKVMATVEAWRSMLPFSISELFYDPAGKSIAGQGPQVEIQLMHNLYFKDKFRRRDARMDEARLLQLAFEGSLFAPQQPIACQQGLMFYGVLKGDPQEAWEGIQARLDRHFPGLVAILARDDITPSAIGCLIAPSEDLLSLSLPRPLFAATSVFLLALSLYLAAQTLSLDPSLLTENPSTWQSLIGPLGLLAMLGSNTLARVAIASYHNSLGVLDYPVTLPAPPFGPFATIAPYKGFLSNRAILLDLSLAPSLAALATSASLLLIGSRATDFSSAPDSPIQNLENLVTLPVGLLAHSTLMTKIANDVATAVFVGDNGEAVMALSPTAAAGLLGLHCLALSLLPIGILDGGRIVTAIFGRSFQHVSSKVALGAIGLFLFLQSRWLGVLWVGYMVAFARKDDWFQWNEVSDPGPIRKALGILLVGGATLSMLPIPWSF